MSLHGASNIFAKQKEKLMRVADFLARYLSKLGVNNVFMLSGTGSVHLDDAFAFMEDITHICARHEAAAVHMAEAAAKLTGNIGVVIATTGPGGTNAISGVVEAWVDSVPVLVISGQVNTEQVSDGVRSFGVQGFNVIENVEHITKYAVSIRDPFSIKFHLEKAIYHATTGRPGPVWLDIPFDVQAAFVEEDKLPGFSADSTERDLDGHNFNEIATMLTASGEAFGCLRSGIRSAGAIEELKTFLERFKIPSICARMALDILPFFPSLLFWVGRYARA